MDFLIYAMIYAGSALMAYNIFLYMRFARRVRKHGKWDKGRRVLYLPIVLLMLFFIGYIAVGVFGKPDIVIAGILFGGSIFVLVMMLLMRMAFERIEENGRLAAELSAAEEANKAKTFFLSNMTHDIRTPLNAIIGFTTLAKQEQTTPETRLEYIYKIEKASGQLLGIVNDVLEMSRIESGKLENDPAPAELADCVREACEVMKMQAAEKGVGFSYSCDVSDGRVMCDKNLLGRVLMNLLSNAVKFTDAGGAVSLRLTQLSREGDEGRYELRVKDNGIGMDPDFVECLFSPFERERTSTVSKIQGTGLGMPITKSIVDMLGGTIAVDTEKGKGTEFTVKLSFPIVDGEETPVEKHEEIRFDGRRALLVDDNPINIEIARMLLTQAGFEVETAENGKIAVDKLAASGGGYFDVVLMDIQMPVMDGYTATRAIRALPDPATAGVPVVAVTANAFREDIEAAEQAGMNGYVAKPLNVENMLSTLKSVIDEKEQGII